MRLMNSALLALGLATCGVLPATANQDFVVFFAGVNPERLDPEQWRVTAEGKAVLREAAAAHRQWGGYILAAGHDQRVGLASDATERSQRRADAVKAVLVREGVSADAIRTKACGFVNPIVETASGVKEPQNRYVILWWATTFADLEIAESKACARDWK